LAVAVLFGAVLLLPMRASAQGRPDCAAVLRKLNESTPHNGARVPDPVRMANHLGVTPEWVERCAASYGRHLKAREEKPKEDGNDRAVEQVEAEEYEEISREEKETEGDKYVTVIEDDEQNRKKLRNYDQSGVDSSNEWEPDLGHEWEPNLGHEWRPYIPYDDLSDYAE
jgi:hypothetical protein